MGYIRYHRAYITNKIRGRTVNSPANENLDPEFSFPAVVTVGAEMLVLFEAA